MEAPRESDAVREVCQSTLFFCCCAGGNWVLWGKKKGVMRLKRRIAVVTGAAQGIGRAIAQRLSGEGAVLALLDKDGPMLEETARLESASAWVCNVSQRDQVLAAIEQITTTVGPIDILVNKRWHLASHPGTGGGRRPVERSFRCQCKGSSLVLSGGSLRDGPETNGQNRQHRLGGRVRG